MINKECEFCKEKIKKDDKHVILKTVSPSINQESYFHFNCFKKNHDKKVEEKARNMISKIQGQAQGLMQNIMGKVGSFQGSGQLNNLLGIDLDKEMKVDDLTKIINSKKEKKKNGRKKTSKNKS